LSDLNSIQQELERFGLSKNQAKIYLLLVSHSELRVQEIAELAHLPRSSVYDSLKGLFELGVAEEVIGDSYKRIRPYSIGAMHHGLDEEMMRVQRLKSDLKKLEQTLAIRPTGDTYPNTTIRYYRNRSGARQLYWNSLKAKNTVYVMSDWGRGRYVGMKYYTNFVAESRHREISEKVLINPTEANLESIRRFTFPGSVISRTRLEDIRVISEKDITIKGDILMYNNTYATVYLKELEITGFEIESPQFVTTQRSIFEVLWQSAKPVSTVL
jgi:sugar-specific transcriptional regulator TrmB